MLQSPNRRGSAPVDKTDQFSLFAAQLSTVWMHRSDGPHRGLVRWPRQVANDLPSPRPRPKSRPIAKPHPQPQPPNPCPAVVDRRESARSTNVSIADVNRMLADAALERSRFSPPADV